MSDDKPTSWRLTYRENTTDTAIKSQLIVNMDETMKHLMNRFPIAPQYRTAYGRLWGQAWRHSNKTDDPTGYIGIVKHSARQMQYQNNTQVFGTPTTNPMFDITGAWIVQVPYDQDENGIKYEKYIFSQRAQKRNIRINDVPVPRTLIVHIWHTIITNPKNVSALLLSVATRRSRKVQKMLGSGIKVSAEWWQTPFSIPLVAEDEGISILIAKTNLKIPVTVSQAAGLQRKMRSRRFMRRWGRSGNSGDKLLACMQAAAIIDPSTGNAFSMNRDIGYSGLITDSAVDFMKKNVKKKALELLEEFVEKHKDRVKMVKLKNAKADLLSLFVEGSRAEYMLVANGSVGSSQRIQTYTRPKKSKFDIKDISKWSNRLCIDNVSKGNLPDADLIVQRAIIMLNDEKTRQYIGTIG